MENIELFKNIKDTELDNLLGLTGASSKVYKKNSVIWQKNSPIKDIGVILVGEVVLKSVNGDIFDKKISGQLIGADFVCAGFKKIPFDYIAEKQSGVLFIPYEKIISLHSDKGGTKLIKNLFEIISKKNVALEYRMNFLEKKTTREKILAYLNAETEKTGAQTVLIPFSREEMASYLCADRSALSRELSRLHDEGVLEYRKNEFTILKG